MKNNSIAIYRLPLMPAARVGSLRAVVDRNGQVYLGGSKVIDAQESGAFLLLTLANESVYYVLAEEYQQLKPKTRGK